MLRSMLSGLVLALCAAAVLLIGGGSELEHVALLGAALGGVIGLVPNGRLMGRLSGFALGFVAAWIAFGVRVLLLPDTTAGRAVAAFLVILICSAVAGISAGRVPLWSTLVGAAAIVASYEASYTSSPSQFLTASPQAATTVLFAAGFGFIGTTVITTFLPGPDATSAVTSMPTARSTSKAPAMSTSGAMSTTAALSTPGSASAAMSTPGSASAAMSAPGFALPDIPPPRSALPDLPPPRSALPDIPPPRSAPDAMPTPGFALPDIPPPRSAPDATP